VAALTAAALFCVTSALLALSRSAPHAGDFTYVWFAARALLNGANPYTTISARDVPYEPRFYYPLTAAVIALPFAWMKVNVAACLMTAITGGLSAFMITRNAWWPLLLFLSAPAYFACLSGQWSFLVLLAALVAPALGPAGAVKPNLAFVMLLRHWTWRASWVAFAVGGTLLTVSLVIRPRWPIDWWNVLHQPGAQQYQIPALTLFGAPLWLGLARWRDPDARLLVGMACVPQGAFFYDQLPLLLIAKSRTELLIAVVLSHVAAFIPTLILPDHSTAVTLSHSLMPFVIAGLYWPALLVVLRRHRNRPLASTKTPRESTARQATKHE
jgi:hypothetical protein